MILANKCYEIVSQESAEQGEVEERGFEFEDQPFTFRELCAVMKRYSETSSYPTRPDDWLTSEPDHDYGTGDETRYSLHYSRNNKPRAAKYWEKALRKAGFRLR